MDIASHLGNSIFYNGIEVFPIIGDKKTNIDFIDLKTGMEMGLVEVKECEPETVSSIIVINNAINPLILVDGEEIAGAKQNRIINQTTIIEPKSQKVVSVSCTEQGRWTYKGEFEFSDYFANSSTRMAKSMANKDSRQSEVWNSIADLQEDRNELFLTSAMRDSYESSKQDIEEYLNHFPIQNNQVGAIVAINGEIKGMEIFGSPEIYKNYHERILKSFIIEVNDDTYAESDVDEFVDDISKLNLKEVSQEGMGKRFQGVDKNCNGTVVNLDGNLIHGVYFKI